MKKVLELGRILASWPGSRAVWVGHLGQIQKTLRQEVDAELAVVVLRRMSARGIRWLVAPGGCARLTRGEHLGQRTAKKPEDRVAIAPGSLPVFRPLIILGKQEITERALKGYPATRTAREMANRGSCPEWRGCSHRMNSARRCGQSCVAAVSPAAHPGRQMSSHVAPAC